MKRLVSFFVVLVVIASSVAAQAQSADYWLKYTEKLPIGSTVVVRTTDGRRITAVLTVVDDTGITVAPKTRRPEPPRHIPFDQLAQVEIKGSGMGTGKAVAIGVAAGAGSVFVVLLALIAASWD